MTPHVQLVLHLRRAGSILFRILLRTLSAYSRFLNLLPVSRINLLPASMAPVYRLPENFSRHLHSCRSVFTLSRSLSRSFHDCMYDNQMVPSAVLYISQMIKEKEKWM